VVLTLSRDQAKTFKGLLDLTGHRAFRLIAEPIAFQQRLGEEAPSDANEDWEGKPEDHRRTDTNPAQPGDADHVGQDNPEPPANPDGEDDNEGPDTPF